MMDKKNHFIAVHMLLYRLRDLLRLIWRKFEAQLKNYGGLQILHKGIISVKRNGFCNTGKKLYHRLCWRVNSHLSRPFTRKELKRQKRDVFPRDVQFSILVPLYNTPEKFLNEMIRSVLCQTYENWELCIADGSDEAHKKVEEICKRYAGKDSRILYKKLEQNLGISENSNACLAMSSGDYLALLDHDDLLHPAALYEVMIAICEQNADFIYTDENTFRYRPRDAYCPHFKPDFAPDTLRSYNYVCHFTVFSRNLMKKAGGGFRAAFDGSQDYDLILRLTEKAERIIHVPEILYYWRSGKNSTASNISAKPYALASARKALAEHLEREGLLGQVVDSLIPSTYRIQYKLTDKPLVSILIANKDHIEDLRKCVNSIREKTTYPAWEVIVIENGSTDKELLNYYAHLQRDTRIKIVRWKEEFNYAAINNFGVKYANGKYLLLLNNDTEVITPDWIEQMLMFGQREDVGAVGCMLYYPDDTVQHAGVIIGIGGVAGHAHKHFRRGEYGYMSRLSIAQNFSAVTAACMMVRRSVWEQVGGLNEKFKVAFNDVDFCMRIRRAGYLIVWTPYAELYHYESKSRGAEDTEEKRERLSIEVQQFQNCWKKELMSGDPYYNPNLTLKREDFSLR